MRILIFGLLSFSYFSLFSQECKEYAPQLFYKKLSKKAESFNGYDIVHHKIELQTDPGMQNMSGSVTTTFIVVQDLLSSVPFHLDDTITVDSVFLNGKKVLFNHSDYVLKIALGTFLRKGEIHSVRVYYHGNPTKSYYQAYRVDHHGQDSARAPIIWTLSEPYGSQDWWPCKNTLDDKIDSLDLIVIVPLGNKVAGNGLLMPLDTINSTVVYHWKNKYPIATYLVGFAVTNYIEYTDTVKFSDGRKLNILNYIYPEYLSTALVGTPATIRIMQFYDSLFGPYPFMKEKYGHAMFGRAGGMEHQTMSFMGNFGYGLVAHELAHQWFGNMVTCGSWHDLWLNEGFATYLTALCYQNLKPDEWSAIITQIKSDVVAMIGGSVYAIDTADQPQLFSPRLTYKKGALVLHTLRFVLGDSIFFAAIRNYLYDAKTKYSFARSGDLQYHFEKSSGKNLYDFFDQWITGQGHPVYKILWGQLGRTVHINVNQQPSHPAVTYFDIPIPLLLKGKTRDSLIVFTPKQDLSDFNFSVPFQVQEIVFDPYNQILAVGETARTGDSSNRFILFPNPANNHIYVASGNKTTELFSLYATNGQEVLKIDLRQSPYETQLIDLSGISPGIYIYRCQTNEGLFHGKVVVVD